MVKDELSQRLQKIYRHEIYLHLSSIFADKEFKETTFVISFETPPNLSNYFISP